MAVRSIDRAQMTQTQPLLAVQLASPATCANSCVVNPASSRVGAWLLLSCVVPHRWVCFEALPGRDIVLIGQSVEEVTRGCIGNLFSAFHLCHLQDHSLEEVRNQASWIGAMSCRRQQLWNFLRALAKARACLMGWLHFVEN